MALEAIRTPVQHQQGDIGQGPALPAEQQLTIDMSATLASKEQQLQQLQQEIQELKSQLQAAEANQEKAAAAEEAAPSCAGLNHSGQGQLPYSTQQPISLSATAVEGNSTTSQDHCDPATLPMDEEQAVHDIQGSSMQHPPQQLQEAPTEAPTAAAAEVQVVRPTSVFAVHTPELPAPGPAGGRTTAASEPAAAEQRVLPGQQPMQTAEYEAAGEAAAAPPPAPAPAGLRGFQQVIPQLQQQYQQQQKAQPAIQQEQQQQQQQGLTPLALSALQTLISATQRQQQQHAAIAEQHQQQQRRNENSQPNDQYHLIMQFLQSLQQSPDTPAQINQHSEPHQGNPPDVVTHPLTVIKAAAAVAAAADEIHQAAAPEALAQAVGASNTSSLQQQPFLHPLVATAAAATAAAATQLELRTAAGWDNAGLSFKDRCHALAEAAAKQQTSAGVDLKALGWQDVMLLLQPIEDEMQSGGHLGKAVDVTTILVEDKKNAGRRGSRKGSKSMCGRKHRSSSSSIGGGSSSSDDDGQQGEVRKPEGPVLGYYDFAQYFMLSAEDAAAVMVMGLTKFKGKIRQLGITRWPSREYKALAEAIEYLNSKGNDARDHSLKPMRILLLKHLKCLLDKYPNMNFDVHPARDIIDALHKQKYKKRKQGEKEALAPAAATPAAATPAAAAAGGAAAGNEQILQQTAGASRSVKPQGRKRVKRQA